MKAPQIQMSRGGALPGLGQVFGTTLASLILAVLLAASAWASLPGAQIDQSILTPQGQGQNYGIAVSANQSLGQTFVVGLSGRLTEIDLQMGRRETALSPLQVELRKTAAGVPDLSAQGLLFSTSLDPSLFPIGIPYGFTAAISLGDGVPVTSGDQLAVVCLTGGDWYYWSSWNLADIYNSGSTVWRPTSRNYFVPLGGQDSGLQTWVMVPEPVGLLPLGLAVLGVYHRRRG
jgi:hypothetical protein